MGGARRVVCVAGLVAGCVAGAEPVAPLALHLEGPAQHVLERLDTFELRVFDELASCAADGELVAGSGTELDGSPYPLHVGENAALAVSPGERVIAVTGREGATDVVRGCARVTLVAGMESVVPVELFELQPGDTCANPIAIVPGIMPAQLTLDDAVAEDYAPSCQPGDDDSAGDQVFELTVPAGGKSVLVGRLPRPGNPSTGTIALSKSGADCGVEILGCPAPTDRIQFINCASLAEGSYDVIVDAPGQGGPYDLLYRARAPVAADTPWVLDSEALGDAERGFGQQPYIGLAGATSLLDGGSDRDEGIFRINLTYMVDFYGLKFDHVFVSANGAVLFVPGAPQTLPVSCVDQMLPPMAAVFFDDLVVPPGGDIRYAVSGSAPRRRLTIEWFKVDSMSCNGGACNGATSFQIEIGENGDLAFNYAGQVTPPVGIGPAGCENPLLGCAAAVGLRILPQGQAPIVANLQCDDPSPTLKKDRLIVFVQPDACEVP